MELECATSVSLSQVLLNKRIESFDMYLFSKNKYNEIEQNT